MTGLVAGSIGGIANIFGDLQRGFGAIEEVMDLIVREREGWTSPRRGAPPDRIPRARRAL